MKNQKEVVYNQKLLEKEKIQSEIKKVNKYIMLFIKNEELMKLIRNFYERAEMWYFSFLFDYIYFPCLTTINNKYIFKCEIPLQIEESPYIRALRNMNDFEVQEKNIIYDDMVEGRNIRKIICFSSNVGKFEPTTEIEKIIIKNYNLQITELQNFSDAIIFYNDIKQYVTYR